LLTDRRDVELVSLSVPHVLDLMLHSCGDQAIRFGVRHAFSHLSELLVFEKTSDLRPDLRAKATAFRNDRAFRECVIRSPDIDRQDPDLLIEREITDDWFELGDLSSLLPSAFGKDQSVVALV